jgi:hypothetical protein
LAQLPNPVGIDETLVSIAAGLAQSAKLLPELSRSEVGAVAMKSASVAVHFEMARTALRAGSSVALGVRTFGISASNTRSADRAEAINRGSISFEVVAIVERPERDAEVADTGSKGLQALRSLIDILRAEETLAKVPDDVRKELLALADVAEAHMAAGDLVAAAEVAERIEKLYTEALGTSRQGRASADAGSAEGSAAMIAIKGAIGVATATAVLKSLSNAEQEIVVALARDATRLVDEGDMAAAAKSVAAIDRMVRPEEAARADPPAAAGTTEAAAARTAEAQSPEPALTKGQPKGRARAPGKTSPKGPRTKGKG